MNFHPESYEEERLKFIRDCLENDTPRLANETYSDQVLRLTNIEYDLYVAQDKSTAYYDEAFFLIHGGAFVYGVKENDTLFGTELALMSDLPVFNVEYPLLPDANLIESLQSLLNCADSISSKYGVKKFHLTGDSAGGYLAFALALLMNSEPMRASLNLSQSGSYEAASAAPICGCYRGSPDSFPTYYFTRDGEVLPDFMYDLGEAAVKFGAPKTFICTGEEDFLREDNEYLFDKLREAGIPCSFYIGHNSGDRVMSHIFPIPNKDWPETREVMRLMVENAE